MLHGMTIARVRTRNVSPRFTPWFSALHPESDEGAIFLGRFDGGDLYATSRGEYLARTGNNEAAYGCLGKWTPEGTIYSLAAALAERCARLGKGFSPCEWGIAPAAAPAPAPAAAPAPAPAPARQAAPAVQSPRIAAPPVRRQAPAPSQPWSHQPKEHQGWRPDGYASQPAPGR